MKDSAHRVLDSAIHTDEDIEIWGRISPGVEGDRRSRWFWTSMDADRRDATIMLNLAIHWPREYCVPHSPLTHRAWACPALSLEIFQSGVGYVSRRGDAWTLNHFFSELEKAPRRSRWFDVRT